MLLNLHNTFPRVQLNSKIIFSMKNTLDGAPNAKYLQLVAFACS